MKDDAKTSDRVARMKFSSVYPLYVTKVEKKGRTVAELHQVISWLTGYSDAGLRAQLDKQVDFRTFFAEAPAMHPDRELITGVICGVRVENIEDPFMRQVRYLDKLVDELAKGKQLEKIFRAPKATTPPSGKARAALPASMRTGKASAAKAAEGDKPVFAYIASLPEPQRTIAQRVDALAARTLPGLQRAVKWGMSYYGVGDGWCFCCGGFADHVKVMFINGVALTPVPPVTPVAMGKSTRGVEIESVAALDERQLAAWMKQVTAVPGVGGRKR